MRLVVSPKAGLVQEARELAAGCIARSNGWVSAAEASIGEFGKLRRTQGMHALWLMASRGNASHSTAGVQFTLTVTALEAYKNKAVSYIATVMFADSVGNATLPGNYTFKSTDKGRHVFNVTLNTTGVQTLTVKDTVHPAVKGSVTITVQAGLDAVMADYSANSGIGGPIQADLDLFFALSNWCQSDGDGLAGIWS